MTSSPVTVATPAFIDNQYIRTYSAIKRNCI